jgi:tRNA (cmo5U34)-methyltransferase
LRVFAEAHPAWTFDGVDPSVPECRELELAKQTLGQLVSRATLHRGYVDDAPIGSFDGAT